MALLTYSLPTIGNPNSSEAPLIRTALSQILTTVNALDSTNIASGTVTDANLASPNNPAFRTVDFAQSGVGGSIGVNTYFPFPDGSFGTSGSAALPNQVPAMVPITATDYAVAGKTTKLRVRLTWATNAVAPTSTFTAGLYPITSTANSTNYTLTLGTVVTGSTAALAAPAASSNGQVASSEISLPANGVYVLGFAISGATTAANSATLLRILLQMRYV